MKQSVLVIILAVVAILQPAKAEEEQGEGRLGGIMFEITDADGDGMISREEYIEAAVRRAERSFERLDSNSDRYISKEEAEEAGRKLREFLQKRRETIQQQNEQSRGQ